MSSHDSLEDIKSQVMVLKSKRGVGIVVSLDHYRCQRVIPQDTKAEKISNTVEFLHQTITTPVVTPEDRILRGLTILADALAEAPTAQSDAQLQSIATLNNASTSWAAPNERPDPAFPIPRHTPSQTICAMKILESKLKQPDITHHPNPRVPNEPARCDPDSKRTIHQHIPAPSPRVNPRETHPAVQPITRHTRSHTKNTQPPISMRTRAQLQQCLRVMPSEAYYQHLPKALLYLWSTPVTDLSMPVLNAETGETLEYRQLRHYPKYQNIWE